MLEKTLKSPLDCKEIQPVHPKGDQSWVFIGGTDVEAETPIFWPPDSKSWLIWKDPWCWERLRAGGAGDDRRWDGWMTSLTQWTWIWVDSGSWWWTGRPGVLQFGARKESDTTEGLNWTELNSVLRASRTGKTSLQIVIFRSRFYEPNPSIFTYLEKHSNHSWWHQLLASNTKLLQI